MKFYFKTSIFAAIFIFGGVFAYALNAWAMPVGTLLYRTSGDGQMYGYSTNLIIDGSKINCGHVGMYVGDVDGEDMVIEAVNNGIQLTNLKYFVNLDKGEEFVGARIPINFTVDDVEKISVIKDFLIAEKLDYDIDFGQQKGPASGEFTCVGLTEKIYESLNFGDKITSLEQLEYNQDDYYIDITSDGLDNDNIHNEEFDDVFSENKEFSKIAKRNNLIGIAGNGLGLMIGDNNYFFFPYSQYLQPTLKDVEVDPEILSSRFKDKDVRGGSIALAVLSQGIRNNTKYTAKKTVKNVRYVASKTKELAVNTTTKLKGGVSGVFSSIKNKFKKNKEATSKETEIVEADEIVDDSQGRVLASSESKEEEREDEKPAVDKVQEIKTIAKEEQKEEQGVLVEVSKEKSVKDSMVEYASLKRVIDGDTIELLDGRRVRYIGIDSPELKESGASDDECLAWVARVRNSNLLGNKQLRLIADSSGDKDKYGRILRYVYVGDVFVNKVLVNEGLAEVFFCGENWENCPVSLDEDRKREITEAGDNAKINKRGIYSDVCKKTETKKEVKKVNDVVEVEDETEEELNPRRVSKRNPPRMGGGEVELNKEKEPGLPLEASKEKESSSSVILIGVATSTSSTAMEEVATSTEVASTSEVNIASTTIQTDYIKYFGLYDRLTRRNTYTSNTVVGIRIQLDPDTPLESVFLSNDIEAEIIWQDYPPISMELKGEQGENFAYLWIKCATSTEMASTSIMLDSIAPLFEFSELKEKDVGNGYTLSWDAIDTASGSGVYGYQIEYMLCDTSCDNVWKFFLQSMTLKEADYNNNLEVGQELHFRGRAVDSAGNIGAWDFASTSVVAEEDVGVIISQFSTRGAESAYDEFVELYNPGTSDIDISGWKLESRSVSTSSSWMSRVGAGLELSIKSQGYLLLAGKDYQGIEPDYRHSANWRLSDSGGYLRIIDASGLEIDQLRWGEVAEPASPSSQVDFSSGGSLIREAFISSTTVEVYDTDSDYDFVYIEDRLLNNSSN